MKELAAFFNCSVDTLERNVDLAEVIRTSREKGKSSVRRMMWLHGEKGNSTALRYLVYNVLKEKLDDHSNQEHVAIVLTPEQEENRRLYTEWLKSRE